MNKRYRWQDFFIDVETNSEEIFALIEKHTNFQPTTRDDRASISLKIHDLEQGMLTLQPPVDAECISKGCMQLEEVRDYASYKRGYERWRIFEDYGAYHMDLEKKWISIERLSEEVEFEYYSALILVLMPMMELMKGFGIYRFHSGCAEVKGHPILLAGQSGDGKSTATFALLQRGYQVLSDEMPLIRFEKGQYEAAVLSDKVKIREDSRQRFFAEFSKEREFEHWQGEWYMRLRDMEAEPVNVLKDIQHLFVLKKTGKKETKIIPMHPAKAVSSLFPVTIKLGIEEETESVFEFVMTFLNRIRCYRVDFGTDMDDFVQRLEEVFED